MENFNLRSKVATLELLLIGKVRRLAKPLAPIREQLFRKFVYLRMDLQASKIELAKLILNIENPKLISKMINLLKSEEKDFWIELTPEQQEEVKLAIEQLDRGERKSWEEVRSKVA